MANLVHAKCSAESNQAIEDCTCEPSYFGGPGEEFCHETADKGTKTRKDVDLWSLFNNKMLLAKNLQNCGLDQNEMCRSPSAHEMILIYRKVPVISDLWGGYGLWQ